MKALEAGLDGVTFQSQGSKLLGAFYRGAGSGPRPTAILVHGLPGTEKNLDIAYGLREAGWNCLFFSVRGAWGSEGAYTLTGRRDDLAAATEWTLQQTCVDAARLALVGHSAGGYLALMSGASDARIGAIVALCPMLSPTRAPLTREFFEESADMLRGIGAQALQAEWATLVSVETEVERLRDRPVLIITGRRDTAFPPEHYPPLRELAQTIEWHEFANGDHSLSACRREAAALTVRWLVAQLGN